MTKRRENQDVADGPAIPANVATDRAERIARARKALADRYAADPEAVQSFNLRMARLSAAAKRERQRVDHLVLGKERPTAKGNVPNRKGRRKLKVLPVILEPGIEEAVQLRERWSHKTFGTPETWDTAGQTHQGALAQLYANGTIDSEQLEWAAEIANVHRSITSDVTISIASLEARVDQSRSGRSLTGESVKRVRMHLAYGYWREMLPDPKRLVLDMIVGDSIGYTVAAARYRVHHRKARRFLLAALDRWPDCVTRAHRSWSAEDHAEARDRAA